MLLLFEMELVDYLCYWNIKTHLQCCNARCALGRVRVRVNAVARNK